MDIPVIGAEKPAGNASGTPPKPIPKPPLTKVGAPKMPPRPAHPFKVNLDVKPPTPAAHPPTIPKSPEEMVEDTPTALSSAIAAATTEVPMVTSAKELPGAHERHDVKPPTVSDMRTHTRPPKMDRKGSLKRGSLIFLCMLIAAAGGAGYAYWQNKRTTPAVKVTQKTTTPVTNGSSTKPTAVNASDVDKTTTGVNTSLNKLNDSKDYNSNDLSDTTLGL